MAITKNDLFFTQSIQGGRRVLVKQRGESTFCVCDDAIKAQFLVSLLNNNLDQVVVLTDGLRKIKNG